MDSCPICFETYSKGHIFTIHKTDSEVVHKCCTSCAKECLLTIHQKAKCPFCREVIQFKYPNTRGKETVVSILVRISKLILKSENGPMDLDDVNFVYQKLIDSRPKIINKAQFNNIIKIFKNKSIEIKNDLEEIIRSSQDEDFKKRSGDLYQLLNTFQKIY